jgi:hypothetical protein
MFFVSFEVYKRNKYGVKYKHNFQLFSLIELLCFICTENLSKSTSMNHTVPLTLCFEGGHEWNFIAYLSGPGACEAPTLVPPQPRSYELNER